MKYDQATIDKIADYGDSWLADLADSYSQNAESASFFTSIRDTVLERVGQIDPEDWERELVEDYSGQAYEIADGAPDVYTWTRWQEFVGTQAWQEDLTELGFEFGPDYAGSLDGAAGAALYMIASRLVAALAAEIQDTIVDDESES